MANSRIKLYGRLRQDHKLTRRQAEFAVAFLDTARIANSAARIGIERSTANQYIKAVYHKTGAHNQAELMKLLMKLEREIEQ